MNKLFFAALAALSFTTPAMAEDLVKPRSSPITYSANTTLGEAIMIRDRLRNGSSVDPMGDVTLLYDRVRSADKEMRDIGVTDDMLTKWFNRK